MAAAICSHLERSTASPFGQNTREAAAAAVVYDERSVMRDQFHWARLLAFVTGLVNQELLLRNEYLAAENRILRAHLPSRFGYRIRSDRRSPRSPNDSAAKL